MVKLFSGQKPSCIQAVSSWTIIASMIQEFRILCEVNDNRIISQILNVEAYSVHKYDISESKAHKNLEICAPVRSHTGAL
jgi:hypothetical protein